MKAGLPTPSRRAMAIANGLIRSGRAPHPQAARGFIRLAGTSGGRYFVSFDGERVLRGDTVEQASEIQQRLYRRHGAQRGSRTVSHTAPQSPSDETQCKMHALIGG